jgi:hypothetical protein
MPPLLPPRLLLPPPARSCRRFATAAPMAMNTKNSALKIPATTGTLAHLKAVGQLPEGRCYCDMCTHIFPSCLSFFGRGKNSLVAVSLGPVYSPTTQKRAFRKRYICTRTPVCAVRSRQRVPFTPQTLRWWKSLRSAASDRKNFVTP